MTESNGASGGGIVVIGGGISGLTTALEAAETGHDVFLLEQEAFLGGRVARLNEYFPKLCPPSCGLEINFRRLKQNPRVQIMTLAEVKKVEGKPGDFTVTVELKPRRVNANCTACDACVPACPVERPDSYNYGMGTTKAIYLPYRLSHPNRHVIDEATCLGESCGKCLAYCPYEAIDLKEEARTLKLNASAVVVATGWKPYDASKLTNLGYGRLPDVITNTMMERLASKEGPTGGKIVRPSDGGPMRRVAFVQCAGSRDEHHLDYCSTVCCSATFKQVTYIREQYPDAEIHVFYIDIRTMGTLEDFFTKVKKDDKLFLHKGKVAKISRAASNTMIITAEDTMTGKRTERVVDLAVLATGMEPAVRLEGDVDYDDLGFVALDSPAHGAGCAKRPVEVAASVQDATGAALRAIQDIVRR
jgi:quinone-modifying oxidoreductase, subunit QmoA